MNITKNNQVEDLKTYSVARTINWRETFEVEVQAKNEEEATMGPEMTPNWDYLGFILGAF